MGKKNGNAKSKAKKEARKAAQLEAQRQLDTLRVARELANPLSALPAPFTAFKRNGLDANVEFYTAKSLPEADKLALHTILDQNMAPIYGQKDWDEEAGADKRKELAEEEARVLVIRAAGAAEPASPATTPVKAPAEASDEKASETKASTDVLAFMHFRYEIEEECLLLYIYELQVADREDARRKGLGKFMLMLAEMLSKKSGFGGVMFTVQKTNEAAIKFYQSCKYKTDAISPCNVDPMADEEDYSYEVRSCGHTATHLSLAL
jgi:ribosomal protein S18 acetylase RimI-like enzyme